MALQGTLDTMSLPDLLQWLGNAQKSGTILLTQGNTSKRLFLREGLVTGSASDDPSEFLGQFLLSYGRISEEQLRDALSSQQGSSEYLGAHLLRMGALSEAPIYIDDSPTLSAMEIRAKVRKVKAEHGLGLVMVDYIQKIQARGRAENRTQELSEIARALKSLAKELGVPLIAISQLSRAAEGLGARRPLLSHLRESGELEAVADVVLFLYREEYYDLDKAQREGKENVCEVIVAKHRNGPVGTIELYFDKAMSRFSNLEGRR